MLNYCVPPLLSVNGGFKDTVMVRGCFGWQLASHSSLCTSRKIHVHGWRFGLGLVFSRQPKFCCSCVLVHRIMRLMYRCMCWTFACRMQLLCCFQHDKKHAWLFCAVNWYGDLQHSFPWLCASFGFLCYSAVQKRILPANFFAYFGKGQWLVHLKVHCFVCYCRN